MKTLILAAVFVPCTAFGATIVTTTAVDEDDGSLVGGAGVSLREAVKYSAAGDTITFAPSLSGQTIRLTLGQIKITKALTIDGSTLSDQVTLSGDKTGNGKTSDDSRVLDVNDVALKLDSLVFSDSINSTDTYGGGAIHAIGHAVRLTIDRCTFRENHGNPEGGAILFFGAYQSPETELIVRNSTFSGNSAPDIGGAIYAFGILDIQNSTITNNTATNGGGVFIASNSTALVQATTITENIATTKGGGISNTAILTLVNSIVAGNFAPVGPMVFGTFTGSNNLTTGNPRLAPLGDYGGPSQTMPPTPGSPVIHAGGTSTLAADQRGFPRVGAPDIGAAEYQGRADLARFWQLDLDGDGIPYGVEQALGTDPAAADPAHSRLLTAPSFTAAGHAVLSFGIAPAAPGTRWILKRSPDLGVGSFAEIYRTDGITDTAVAGISFVRTASSATITDENPLASRAFYRFEALLEP